MTDATYVPPKVWTWEAGSGGKFANINRPIAGATHDKTLPVGKHPMQLHSLATPNGVKVSVMLEELLAAGFTGAEYDAYIVNIMEGEQFGSDFVAINPNSKIPALMDNSTNPPTRVFESGAILLYPCRIATSLGGISKSSWFLNLFNIIPATLPSAGQQGPVAVVSCQALVAHDPWSMRGCATNKRQ